MYFRNPFDNSTEAAWSQMGQGYTRSGELPIAQLLMRLGVK